MTKKKVVVALGHTALGKTMPEQKENVKKAAKAIADLVEEGQRLPSLTVTPTRLA